MCGLARLWIPSVSVFKSLPISQLGKFSDLFIDAVRDLSPFVTNHAFCICSLGMLQCCWVPICGKCPSAVHLRCNIGTVTGQSLHLLSVMLRKEHKTWVEGWKWKYSVAEHTLSLSAIYTNHLSRSHSAKGSGPWTKRGCKAGCQLKRVLSALK